MPDISNVRGRAQRLREFPASVNARLTALEDEMQEQRQLARRVAELTDLVTELLVPLSQRRDDEVKAIVDRYRASL